MEAKTRLSIHFFVRCVLPSWSRDLNQPITRSESQRFGGSRDDNWSFFSKMVWYQQKMIKWSSVFCSALAGFHSECGATEIVRFFLFQVFMTDTIKNYILLIGVC